MVKRKLNNRDVTLHNRSQSGTVIQELEDDDFAEKLVKEMSANQTVRFLTGFMLRNNGEASRRKILKVLRSEENSKRYDKVKDSFVTVYKCPDCNRHIGHNYYWEDKPEILNCGTCRKEIPVVKTENDDSKGIIKERDVTNLVQYLKRKGIFDTEKKLYCYNCGFPRRIDNNRSVDLECQSCGNHQEVYTTIFFDHKENSPVEKLKDSDEKGTWFEWYVRELLLDELDSLVDSDILTGWNFHIGEGDNRTDGEFDNVFGYHRKVIGIECKDSSSSSSGIEGLTKLARFCDIIVVGNTTGINENQINPLSEFPDTTLLYFDGGEIEEFCDILSETIVEDLLDEINKNSLRMVFENHIKVARDEEKREIKQKVDEELQNDFEMTLEKISGIQMRAGREQYELIFRDNENLIEENLSLLMKWMNSSTWMKNILAMKAIRRVYDEEENPKLADKFQNKLHNLFNTTNGAIVHHEIAITVQKLGIQEEFKEELTKMANINSRPYSFVPNKAREVLREESIR